MLSRKASARSSPPGRSIPHLVFEKLGAKTPSPDNGTAKQKKHLCRTGIPAEPPFFQKRQPRTGTTLGTQKVVSRVHTERTSESLFMLSGFIATNLFPALFLVRVSVRNGRRLIKDRRAVPTEIREISPPLKLYVGGN